jgi:hypothetical protein
MLYLLSACVSPWPQLVDCGFLGPQKAEHKVKVKFECFMEGE